MEDSSAVLDSHSLIVDLNELLRRDPTLSSLEEKPNAQAGGTNNVASLNAANQRQSGVAIPGNKISAQAQDIAANPSSGSMFLKINDFPGLVQGSNPANNGSMFRFEGGSRLGSGAFDQSSSFGSISPSLGLDQSSSDRQPMAGNVNQMTLTQLNSLTENDFLPASTGTGIKMETNDYDDIEGFFLSNSSPNVTFGLPPPEREIKLEPMVMPKQEPQDVKPTSSFATLSNLNFWQANTDEMLFGAAPPSMLPAPQHPNALLSSSVPALFSNPLSDILTDLPPPSSSADSNKSPCTLSPPPPPEPVQIHSPSQAGPTRHSTLHRLLAQRKGEARPSPVRSPESRKTLDQMKSSLSVASGQQLLSRSAPSNNTHPMMLQQQQQQNMWMRREPRQHMSSVCSVGEASSIADDVNDVLESLSPSDDLQDIASDDEEDPETYFQDDKDSSDDDSDIEGTSPTLPMLSTSSGSGGKKVERHFWQYNVQAKGPKGQKILIETKMEDPHVLTDIVDPVFSGDVQLQGIKHSGKARRGDGNDLTSNPRKLAAIGKELEQLSKVINDMTPVSEVPSGVRCKSRKEKNKLASRVCRLKKKAQHEANKVKCTGLLDEHRQLSDALQTARVLMVNKMDPNCATPQAELTTAIDQLVEKSLAINVAGNTTNYVNDIIAKHLPYV